MCCLHISAQAADCANVEGRLNELAGADQQIRQEWDVLWQDARATQAEREALQGRWRAIDGANLKELKEIVAACGAVAGCVYLLAGAVLVLRYRGRRSAQQGAPPAAVTVLVPLCGDEAGLSARLIRLRRQKHGAPVQILCGVSEAGDPALKSVREAQAETAKA